MKEVQVKFQVVSHVDDNKFRCTLKSLHLLCNGLMKWAVPDLVLTAYVPHCEADILVLHSLHVKAYKRRKRINIKREEVIFRDYSYLW